MNTDEIKIFAGSSGHDFATRMCEYLNIDLRPTEVTTFSEGNTYVKIGEHVRGKSVYLVQPIALNANNEFMELLFWMDAFKRSGAAYVTAIIPYFGYAKGDKKDEPRVSIRARVCAECLELAGADRVITMDLHAAQIQGFFKRPVDHLFARPLLAKRIEKLGITDAVIVAPDAGFAKDARKFADYLKVPVAIGDKMHAVVGEKSEIMELIGDVNGKISIIVDDFSISGGTLVNLSKLLLERGSTRIFACLSHLPLSEKGVEKLINSPIEKIISTDTIANLRTRGHDKFEIVSVAPLFAEVVKRMESGKSISSLFDAIPEDLLKTFSV